MAPPGFAVGSRCPDRLAPDSVSRQRIARTGGSLARRSFGPNRARYRRTVLPGPKSLSTMRLMSMSAAWALEGRSSGGSKARARQNARVTAATLWLCRPKSANAARTSPTCIGSVEQRRAASSSTTMALWIAVALSTVDPTLLFNPPLAVKRAEDSVGRAEADRTICQRILRRTELNLSSTVHRAENCPCRGPLSTYAAAQGGWLGPRCRIAGTSAAGTGGLMP